MTRDPNALEPLATSSEDAELRAMLEAGRAELPDASQLGALAAKLGPILGPGGTGGGHGGPGGGQVAGAVAKKVVAGALLKTIGAVTLATVVGAGGVYVARASRPGPGRPVPDVTAASGSLPSATPPPSPFPASGEGVSSGADDATAVEAGDPGGSPSAHAAKGSGGEVPRVAPVAPAVDPDAEVTLLQRAQDALARDPAQALALAGEHARRFRSGLLGQEREVLAIEALMRLGRADAARARADRFRASYPSSTHLRRIDLVLLGEP